MQALTMPPLPPDHAQRHQLAAELHTRPPEPVCAPARVSYVAVLVDAAQRASERQHLARLCESHRVSPPDPEATHYRATLGRVRLKWERHGEFSGYTVLADGVDEPPFAHTAAAMLTPGWLAAIPGHTVTAVHAELRPAQGDLPDAVELARLFGDGSVAGGEVAEGAAQVCTDFRLHDDGCTHVLVFDRRLGERQAGRLLQRLFEIEAYRMLALLALPIARQQLPRIAAIEASLATLTDDIAREQGDDESLLQALTRLAAEVESGIAASQFRFGACEAYHGLVLRRIAELRERRQPGMQTIDEFMSRRLTPAVATCVTVSQRLLGLSERVAQASALLSTRVDIARERQNQRLLASMDARAKQQLRLQQTVEGLSVAAIVYYTAGLVGYAAKALRTVGVNVNVDVAVGVAIPFLAVAVYWAVRRARRRIASSEALID